MMNVRDARWRDQLGRGHSVPLTGRDEYEAETYFPMLGMAIRVVQPRGAGRHVPLGDRAGGFPRPVGRGDPDRRGPGASAEAVGLRALPARDAARVRRARASGPCVILCASSRQFQKDGPWGYYCADETAARHNASSPEETQDNAVAYARFAPGGVRALPRRPPSERLAADGGPPAHSLAGGSHGASLRSRCWSSSTSAASVRCGGTTARGARAASMRSPSPARPSRCSPPSSPRSTGR